MYKHILYWTWFLGAVAPGYSQALSIGVKAGVPLNEALRGYSSSAGSVSTNTGRWLVGPTVELHFPFRLSFEVDALYRRESYLVSSISGSGMTNQWFYVSPTISTAKSSLSSWQFPFLAKYDLHTGLLQPFVDAGVTYQHLSGSSPINNPNLAGATIGVGVTIKLLLFRLSPELRYTRWGSKGVDAPYVTSSQNQTDVMIGFTF
jgi:hypothetical protein